MPGIVDPHCHLGIGPWPWVAGNSDNNEAPADPIMPHLKAMDAIDPHDPAMRWVAAGGVTTVLVVPGSANIIGGEGAVLKLKLGRTPEEMLFPGAPRVMKMAVGENPKATYGGKGRMPKTRMGVFALLRDAFGKAAAYRTEWDEWEAQPAASRGAPPRHDPKLEALADVLRGEIHAHIHVYRRDEFLTLLRIADEFGFEIGGFHHAMDAYRIGPELARRGVGVTIYADAFGRKLEHWEQVPQTAAFLNSLGVLVSLHSDFPFFAQRLHTEAAKLVRYGGISEADALRTITINAARLIGVDRWVGSLEKGKHADIAIYSKHPFDSFTLVEKTFVDGELVFDRARDKAWMEHTP
jgi:imidazolonepropionase-like amidohydrolase